MMESNAGLVPAFALILPRIIAGTDMLGMTALLRRRCLGGMLLLAACGAPGPRGTAPAARGESFWRLKEEPVVKRYELAMGQVATGAGLIEREPPVYPPEQLASCPPPVEVEAMRVVDEAGRVSNVRIADTAPAHTRFNEATRAALTRWVFSPLRIDNWAADADGNSHVVKSTDQPFSLTYVFHFECHAGRAMVSPGSLLSAGE